MTTTPAAAVYSFMSSFGIPAYAATSVPEGTECPYLTYELALGDYWDGECGIVVDLWYRGSEAEPNAKAMEISKALRGGKMIPCDGGAVWLKKGEPFCSSMGDTDPKIKRRYINVTAEFITS